MEESYDFDAEFRVRLPAELAERIAQLAQKERRSRNLQYVFMLESFFDRDNALTDRVKVLEEIISRTDDLDNGEKPGKGKPEKRDNPFGLG